MKIPQKPILKTFGLKSDPDGMAQVTIAQARQDDVIRRNELFADASRIFTDDETGGTVEVKQKYNPQRIRRMEAYLTLYSVQGIVDEDGNELFKSKDGKSIRESMSESSFNEKWGLLPMDVVEEIVEFIHEVNPLWDPNGGN